MKKLNFEQLPAIMVKGKPMPIPIYTLKTSPERHHHSARSEEVLELVGRETERAKLDKGLDDLLKGQSTFLRMTGEAGIGKTRLLMWLHDRAKIKHIPVFFTSADPIEKSSYLPWRRIFMRLFGQELSGALAGLNWDQLIAGNQESATTDPNARIAEQKEHMASILEKLCNLLSTKIHEMKGVLVIIDNADWLDCCSSKLAQQLYKRTQHLMMVLAQRSTDAATEDTPTIYTLFTSSVSCNMDHLKVFAEMQVKRMSDAEGQQMLCKLLKVQALAPSTWEIVMDKWHGNPLFLTELVKSMKERFAINQGLAEISSGIHIPATLEGIIIARLDQLSPTASLLVKVASVVGLEFTFSSIAEVFPLNSKVTLPELEIIFHYILDSGYLIEPLQVPQFPNTQGVFHQNSEQKEEQWYTFCSSLVRDTLYNLLLLSQRLELHKMIALRLGEKEYGAQTLSQLAYHWLQIARLENPPNSESISRAVRYLLLLEDHCSLSGLVEDSLKVLQAAMQLLEILPSSDEFRQLIENTVHFRLGTLYQLLDRPEEATSHFRQTHFSNLQLASNEMTDRRFYRKRRSEAFITPERLPKEQKIL